MRHFSCDLCGKDLTGDSKSRYVLRMEVFPATDPRELTPADLDQDHIDAMAELLHEIEHGEDVALAPTCRSLEYDLCNDCQRKFLADPLGRESSRKFRFSKN